MGDIGFINYPPAVESGMLGAMIYAVIILGLLVLLVATETVDAS